MIYPFVEALVQGLLVQAVLDLLNLAHLRRERRNEDIVILVRYGRPSQGSPGRPRL